MNLSNTPQNSEYPAIVADGYGYVHVLWSEDIGGEPFRDTDHASPGNSIVYTRWDGTSWTQPTDVLSAPGEPIARFVAVDVDADNSLHAVWSGQSSIYYSNALSWDAESAHAWSRPVVVATDCARSQWESDVVADAFGNLHIAYATRGAEAGVYHIRSQDGGLTWGDATKLSEPPDRLEAGFSNVKAITDGTGRLHVVWQTFDQAGYGQAIYYARSTDQGESWSPAAQLAYKSPDGTWTEWPYLAARGESELHLIYVSDTNVGRAHRISWDGGETWSQPRRILTELEGINGYVFPLADSQNQMHLITNMRTRTQVLGLYYARWSGNEWLPAAAVDVSGESQAGSHYATGTVRLGNELHVVWATLLRGEIWYVHGIVPSAPQSSPVAVPSLQLPTPTSSTPATTTVASPVPMSPVQPRVSPISTSAPNPTFPVTDNPIALAVGCSLLLVGGVLLWKRAHPR